MGKKKYKLDEKPSAQTYVEPWDDPIFPGSDSYDAYPKEEMDAWINKLITELEEWIKDAPKPLFLEPGRSPFISEIGMEVWLEKCPIEVSDKQ